jgi:adenylate kinase
MSSKVVVFFGPPGVGKGTQCGLLAQRLGVSHVSTGGLLRAEIASGSELGSTVKSTVAAGKLVGDDLLFGCLEAFLRRTDVSTGVLLLDGVPRNVTQVKGLDEVLTRFGLKVDAVVSLVAPVEKLVERFSKRWTCGCGQVEAFEQGQDPRTFKCQKCSKVGSFSRREDDRPEVVTKRMEIYHSETAPVEALYSQRGQVAHVDGLRSVEAVYVGVAKSILDLL